MLQSQTYANPSVALSSSDRQYSASTYCVFVSIGKSWTLSMLLHHLSSCLRVVYLIAYQRVVFATKRGGIVGQYDQLRDATLKVVRYDLS